MAHDRNRAGAWLAQLIKTLALVLLLLLVAACSGSSQSTNRLPSVTAESFSTAYKLAVIDGRTPTSSVEEGYQRELNNAQTACPGYTETNLADLVVRGTTVIAEHGGTPTTTLELLEALNELQSGGNAQLGIDCTELLSTLIAVMVTGQ